MPDTKTASPNKAKRRGGRVGIYRAEYAEQIRKLCLLGCNNNEIANVFGVHSTTLGKWMLRHPAVKQAFDEGREKADAKVAAALYDRATGHSYRDNHIAVIDGKVTFTPIMRVLPPDPNAALKWLERKKPEVWRERTEVAVTNLDEAFARLDRGARRAAEQR